MENMYLFDMRRRIESWVIRNWGLRALVSGEERTKRLLEESIELTQAMDISKEEVLRLVEHVYAKPRGEVKQELGGLGVTLLAFCGSQGLDLIGEMEIELQRIEALPAEHFQKRQNAKAAAGISTVWGTDETTAD